MNQSVKIPESIWNEITNDIYSRLSLKPLDKPIVFAMYTNEINHFEVISCREITTVRVKGDYPNGEYDYTYPGIKNQDFYSRKGTGKWFSGTLVIGDGIEQDEDDLKWMMKEELYFRIKMDRNKSEKLVYNAYCIGLSPSPLELQ